MIEETNRNTLNYIIRKRQQLKHNIYLLKNRKITQPSPSKPHPSTLTARFHQPTINQSIPKNQNSLGKTKQQRKQQQHLNNKIKRFKVRQSKRHGQIKIANYINAKINNVKLIKAHKLQQDQVAHIKFSQLRNQILKEQIQALNQLENDLSFQLFIISQLERPT